MMRVRAGRPANRRPAVNKWGRPLEPQGNGPSTEAPYGLPPYPIRRPSGMPPSTSEPVPDDDDGDRWPDDPAAPDENEPAPQDADDD